MTALRNRAVMHRLANMGKLELVNLPSATSFRIASLLVSLSRKHSRGHSLGAWGTAVRTPCCPVQPGLGQQLGQGRRQHRLTATPSHCFWSQAWDRQSPVLLHKGDFYFFFFAGTLHEVLTQEGRNAFCLSQPQGCLNLHLPFLQQTGSKAVPKSCFTFPADTGQK